MPFMIHAFDYTDRDATTRRLSCREEHLTEARKLHEKGILVLGGALTNAEGNMVGSVVILNTDDRNVVDHFLKHEVYIKNRVWEKIDVYPMRIAIPSL